MALRPFVFLCPYGCAVALALLFAPAVHAEPAEARPSSAAPVMPAGDPDPSPAEVPSVDAGLPAGFDRCEHHDLTERFHLRLPETAELADLVRWMGSISCQKFIWDPQVRGGKVSVLAPGALSLAQAYAAFHSALQTMGLTVEPAGAFYKIVESQDANTRALPVYAPGQTAPASDRYVTQLIRVDPRQQADIKALLEGLKSKVGSVAAVGDMVLITDTGHNVHRMVAIVGQLEGPAQDQDHVFFYQLRHADPEAVSATLRAVFGVADVAAAGARVDKATPAVRPSTAASERGSRGIDPAQSSASRIVVDTHTSTIIIVARREVYAQLAELMGRLDVPSSTGTTRYHFRKLVNADPVEVAAVLNDLVAGAGKSAGKGGAAESVRGEVHLTADPAARALLIEASQRDYLALQPLIDELDTRRRQVYVEVYLLELSMDKRLDVGAAGQYGRPVGSDPARQGLGFATSGHPLIGGGGGQGGTILDPTLLAGLAAGVLGPTVPGSSALLGTASDVPAFGVVIQALAQDSEVNLVAEPHFTTADNKEAIIEVGEQRPILNGVSVVGTTGGLQTSQPNVALKDIALTLKVTPHINDAETLSLDIELANESFAEQLDIGVRTTKRHLQLENVLAQDDHPIVLGGLIQERQTHTEAGVPGLSKIPVLGWLFKRRGQRREKVNLLMVLVPHVLDGPDDSRRIHARRMQERLEFLERQTSFKRRELDVAVDYVHKAGLLSAVNVEAGRMEQELAERRRAEAELAHAVVSGELGVVAAEAAPEQAVGVLGKPGS